MTGRDDRILDTFLEEVLCGRRPPDLTERILRALDDAPASLEIPQVTDDLVRVVEPEAPPIQSPTSLPTPAPVPKPVRTQRPGPILKPNRIEHPTSLAQPKPEELPVVLAIRHRSRRPATSLSDGQVLTALAIGTVACLLLATFAYMRIHSSSPDRGAHQLANQPATRNQPGVERNRQQGPYRSKRGVRQPADAVVTTGDEGSQRRVEQPDTPFDPPRRDFAARPPATTFTRQSLPGLPPVMADTEVVAQIDRWIEQLWKENEVTPTSNATDEEWIRRVYRHVLGRPPTAEERLDFLVSDAANRRLSLLDQLLNSPEFADHWASVWTNVLIGHQGGIGDDRYANRDGLTDFLRESIANNKHWDQLVFELISAEGSNHPAAEDFNGATNFLLSGFDDNGALATGRTARLFLGQRIRCVQCHDHPTVANWSQSQFWELNGFFRQMQVERIDDYARLVDRSIVGADGQARRPTVVYTAPDGTSREVHPRFPGQPDRSNLEAEAPVKGRVRLAYLIAGSRQLRQATVNRVWAQFFGYGLANPVNDLGPHNPPVSPQLLDHLAGQFGAHDFAVKPLVRWIALSKAFGLSSAAPVSSLADAPYAGRPLFTHYYSRPRPREEVYDSLRLVAEARKSGKSTPQQEMARRAWLKQFGQDLKTDERDESDVFHGNIRQSLIIMTDPLLQQATSQDRDTVLGEIINSKLPREKKVEHLFLAAVARTPTRQELEQIEQLVAAQQSDESSALQDIWWALLNSNEFMLDH